MKIKRFLVYLAALVVSLQGAALRAQAKKPKAAVQQAETLSDEEAIPPEVSEADKTAATVEVRDSYYVRSPSYGTEPIDSTQPAYAKRLSETGIGVFRNIDWIIFGVEQRTRGEFRENDFRRPNSPVNPQGPSGNPATQETPVLFKTRAFLKLEFDWFRLVTEVQDSRRTPIKTGADTRDFNEFEPIQAYAEVHFRNLFGYNRPLAVRGGRYALELKQVDVAEAALDVLRSRPSSGGGGSSSTVSGLFDQRSYRHVEGERARLAANGIELEGRHERAAREMALYHHLLALPRASLTLSYALNIGGREA
ncbi:MAG TPA: alginate export family protein, partial [Turneriella sp.]|nr:alginate export family protein [Turneriella sp.]